ncbi:MULTISPECIES: hypothetical protein [Streptomyces]|uniref:hypothetical protein n=1 Tax=Streptomyces TaxID=1883 RepID=UPI00093F5A21|nr:MULTISPECIES: hypothetical protein [Streptomyces]MCX4504935.1 hypothetical protein [Streptomyces anulatus]OKI56883.1 hypothetical protein AMK17_13280 [Streptomyces sp. CB00072]
MAFRLRRILIPSLAGAAIAALGFSTLAVANAVSPDEKAQQGVAAAADAPPYAIEDFAYPGADKIEQTRGLKLFKGDGHIILATCDESPDQIRIWSRQGDEGSRFCFRATASSGFLTLEIPQVFAVQTADRPVSADLSSAGKTKTVDVAKDTLQGVGEGVEGADTVLVELRVTG